MRYDFSELEVIHARARRERAEAVHRILIAPLLALFRRGKRAQPVPCHFAPQG